MEPHGQDSPIGDIAYLARSEHRVPTLTALTDRPRSRSELCELTRVSSSTIRRTLDEFEDRSWIEKDGYQYEVTPLGEAVASGMNDLVGQVETEHKLRDVWHKLPAVVIEFALGTGTTVTRAEHDAPYRPLNRYRSLFHESNRYRFVGFDVGLYEACKEEFEERVLDGLEAEIIDPPSIARYMIVTYPERSADLLDRDNMTVLLHDDVPSYGLCLFDDQIAICVYNPDGGGMKMLIDTDAPEAHEWAESVYATYKAEAQPLEVQQIIE